MRVLVIGSGAREHAIVWKLSQSPRLTKLYCASGNAGICKLAECVDIKADDIDGLLRFALDNKIELTVVGPEAALVKGIVDLFSKNGLRIFGPDRKSAQLEGSKAFAKDFMSRHRIPTARYKVYNSFEKAVSELQYFEMPVVIKADGLAAGKGVIIAKNRQEAVEAIYDIMTEKRFGDAGASIVIEEFLQGHEVSLLAFVDGNTIVPMVSAQDYKRALDMDRGLNTGGMGAVSPAFHYNADVDQAIAVEIVDRTLKALKAERILYKGVLYFGIMLTNTGPKMLEFNARFGDPETEVILLRLQSDLLDIMEAVMDGRLEDINIQWSEEKAVCVVMASGGYPEEYSTGHAISGIEHAEETAKVFHGGTSCTERGIVTSGGRVLVISAMDRNYEIARKKVYAAIDKINFDKQHYRKDIGIN